MIKMVLYSDFDDLIIFYFVAGISFILFLNWFIIKIKQQKGSSVEKILNFNDKLNLNNYTLDFNNEIPVLIKPSLLTKMFLGILSVIIVVLPLYEFIETLRPQEVVANWSCFPF
ncbi:hypothetical protein A9Q86_00980 [Flavobacteriales bacterium 33_180_T64]|nr:hypothetical protein A9Q86_00980 [Flavobacteriales bacterium 33_180_T64]